MEGYFEGVCPHCKSKIYYNGSEEKIECNYCKKMVSIMQLNASRMEKRESLMEEIQTPGAAISYLRKYLEEKNLDYYVKSQMVTIPELDRMVEVQRVKNANLVLTYKLEILSIYMPLNMKLDYLSSLGIKIANEYKDEATSLKDDFNFYRNISIGIIENRARVLKIINDDIEYLKKIGYEADKVNELIGLKGKLEVKLNRVALYNDIYEIPAVKREIDNDSSIISERLKASGIDAEVEYSKALNLLRENKSLEAIAILKSLRGYKDSKKYISRLNKSFIYDGELLVIASNSYYFTKDNNDTLDLKDLKKEAKNQEPINTNLYSLYRVKDQHKEEKPLISGISRLITTYADRMYYLKDGEKNTERLCCYSFSESSEAELLAVKKDSLGLDSDEDYFFTKDSSRLYIKVLLNNEEPKGCLNSFKKKKPELNDNIKNGNNFSLLELDLVNSEAKTIIEGLVEVEGFYDTHIFYTKAKLSFKREEDNIEAHQVTLHSYDTGSGEDLEILDNEADIHNVIGDSVIYTRFNPSIYNSNLYQYNLKTGEERLIESNVYKYYGVIDDRIYYLVGNKDYSSLFCNSLNGLDRHEIMQDIEYIVFTEAGWIYCVRGYGINSVLMRISKDGSRREYVCTGYSELIKISNGLIYYLNYLNELHIVRYDGTDDFICDNISDDNIIISDSIYYMRRELVSNNKLSYSSLDGTTKPSNNKTGGCLNGCSSIFKKPATSTMPAIIKEERTSKLESNNSLYKMDLEGHNQIKLAFDIVSIKDFDDYIYFKEEGLIPFRVTYTEKSKEPQISYKKYYITRYKRLNKLTKAIELVLELGLPDIKEEKKGCLGGLKRNKQGSYKYEEMPKTEGFKNKSLSRVGLYKNALELDSKRTTKIQASKDSNKKVGFSLPKVSLKGRNNNSLNINRVGFTRPQIILTIVEAVVLLILTILLAGPLNVYEDLMYAYMNEIMSKLFLITVVFTAIPIMFTCLKLAMINGSDPYRFRDAMKRHVVIDASISALFLLVVIAITTKYVGLRISDLLLGLGLPVIVISLLLLIATKKPGRMSGAFIYGFILPFVLYLISIIISTASMPNVSLLTYSILIFSFHYLLYGLIASVYDTINFSCKERVISIILLVILLANTITMIIGFVLGGAF